MSEVTRDEFEAALELLCDVNHPAGKGRQDRAEATVRAYVDQFEAVTELPEGEGDDEDLQTSTGEGGSSEHVPGA